jgi:hypothetical protein
LGAAEETVVTQAEIEDELKRLRDLHEARRRNWRSIGTAARILGGLLGGAGLIFAAIGFTISPSLVSGPAQKFAFLQFGLMFVLASLPLGLLAAALRDAVSPR